METRRSYVRSVRDIKGAQMLRFEIFAVNQIRFPFRRFIYFLRQQNIIYSHIHPEIIKFYQVTSGGFSHESTMYYSGTSI